MTKWTQRKGYNKLDHIQWCERCGGNQLLQIHHVVFRSEVPKHVNLHHPNNLLKLCNTCHSWFHEEKERRAEIVVARKLWEIFPESHLDTRYTIETLHVEIPQPKN